MQLINSISYCNENHPSLDGFGQFFSIISLVENLSIALKITLPQL